MTPYENEPARAPTTSRPTPGHMPLVPTGSSPCFSRSESGFDRIRENHLTGLWSTGRRGRRVRVRVCWHPNRNDNCPRPPSPRQHVDLHLAPSHEGEAATIDPRAQADDARCHPWTNNVPASLLCLDPRGRPRRRNGRFAIRREYDEARLSRTTSSARNRLMRVLSTARLCTSHGEFDYVGSVFDPGAAVAVLTALYRDR